MANNKILSFYFFLFVILPLIILYFVGYLAEGGYSTMSTPSINMVNKILILISVTGCGFVAFYNYKRGFSKGIWYTLPITFGLALLALLYFAYIATRFTF